MNSCGVRSPVDSSAADDGVVSSGATGELTAATSPRAARKREIALSVESSSNSCWIAMRT